MKTKALKFIRKHCAIFEEENYFKKARNPNRMYFLNETRNPFTLIKGINIFNKLNKKENGKT